MHTTNKKFFDKKNIVSNQDKNQVKNPLTKPSNNKNIIK